MLHIQLYTGPIEEKFTAFKSSYIDAMMGLNWARLIQQSAPAAADLVLFEIYQDQQLVGLAIVLELKNLKAYRYLWNPIAETIEKSKFLQKIFPCLQVGFLEVPIANYSGLFTASTLTVAQRAEVITLISDYCRQQFKWYFFCVKQDSLNDESKFLNSTFHKLHFLPNAILKLPYQHFNEFVAQLSSKKRRKLFADQKQLANYQGCIEICHEPARISDELYALYQKTNQNKQQQKNYIPTPVPITQAFFQQLAEFPQLQTKAITIRVEKCLIAYCLLMQNDNTLYFKSVGLEYELAVPAHAYFNLIYTAIEFAIQQGYQQIDFGMTSYTFKKRMGCTLHPTYYQVVFYHPLLRLLSKAFLYLLQRQFRTLDDKT
jgi:hypothetical protein